MQVKCKSKLPISIHASREGGDACRGRCSRSRGLISIHASREGGDSLEDLFDDEEEFISIHASREGGDSVQSAQGPRRVYFNPRLPRGRRRK